MMKGGTAGFFMLALIAAWLLAGSGPDALAAIGAPPSKHNMTQVPGYGFGADVCAACHKPHAASGKNTWEGDREAPADGRRNLSPAKAASQDQASGTGDYPGIYLCLDCHSSSAAAPSWSKKPGYAADNVVTHSTREMKFAGYSTKYATFVVRCTDCHDVHQYWDGTLKPGQNLYMIRSVVQTPSGGTANVVFTAMTGVNSLGPNLPSPRTYQALCEACHTQTLYHKNVQSTAHYDRQDCTMCHTHSDGFAGGSCTSCHGDPPVSYNTLVGRPANPGVSPTGAVTAPSGIRFTPPPTFIFPTLVPPIDAPPQGVHWFETLPQPVNQSRPRAPARSNFVPIPIG